MKKIFLIAFILCLASQGMAQTLEHQLPEAERKFALADSLRRSLKEAMAIEAATEAANLYGQSFGTKSAEYGVALGRLAEFHFWNISNDWEEYIEEGLSIVAEANGERCDEYARLLTLYAQFDIEPEDSLERFYYAEKAVDIRREVLGVDHPNYAWSLAKLAEC